MYEYELWRGRDETHNLFYWFDSFDSLTQFLKAGNCIAQVASLPKIIKFVACVKSRLFLSEQLQASKLKVLIIE